MESRHLWLLLTCYQFEALRKGEEVEPDEYSRSFGMRVDPANTDGLDYPSPLTEFGAAYHLKDYVFCYCGGYLFRIQAEGREQHPREVEW